MGRDAGWLTAGSKLASLSNNGPDLIYLPEHPFDLEDFLIRVKNIYDKKQHALVAISEGIKDKDGKYILEYNASGNEDAFGHLQLGGVAQVLTTFVKEKLNLPNRSIELNLPQRCASHIASKTDIDEAFNCGVKAVEFMLQGESGMMVSMNRNNSLEYSISYQVTPLSGIANQVKEKKEQLLKELTENYNNNKAFYCVLFVEEKPVAYCICKETQENHWEYIKTVTSMNMQNKGYEYILEKNCINQIRINNGKTVN